MNRVIIAFAMILSLVSCTNKIEPVGAIVTSKVDVDFNANKINIRSAMELTLTDDIAEGEIRIITNENIHNYIDVVVSGNEVIIDLENNNYKDLDVEILASSSQFNSIKASGASEVTIEGCDPEHDSLNIELSGASELDVENYIYVPECTVIASGASSIDAERLTVDNLEVNLSGASSVEIKANDTISGELSGASEIEYWGSPTLSVECSGASKIEKK